MIEKDAFLKCLEILGKDTLGFQEQGEEEGQNLIEEVNSNENSFNLEAEEAF